MVLGIVRDDRINLFIYFIILMSSVDERIVGDIVISHTLNMIEQLQSKKCTKNRRRNRKMKMGKNNSSRKFMQISAQEKKKCNCIVRFCVLLFIFFKSSVIPSYSVMFILSSKSFIYLLFCLFSVKTTNNQANEIDVD